MNGSLYELSNGRYRVRWRDPDGRGRSRAFDQKDDATKWLSFVRHKTATADLPLPSSPSLGDYLEDWWPRKARRLRPKTRADYESIVRLHLPQRLRSLALRRISARQLEDLLEPLAAEGKMALARKVRAVLSGLFSEAIRDGHVESNPARAARMPSGASESPQIARVEPGQRPAPADVQKLADAVPEWARAVVLLAGFGGLRWSEIAGLPQDFDLEANQVRVERSLIERTRELGRPKSAKSRRVVLFSEAIRDDMAHHLAVHATDEIAMPSAEGSRLHHSNFRRRVWLPATRALGLDGVRFHDYADLRVMPTSV